MIRLFFTFFMLSLILSSCSTKKNIILVQDIKPSNIQGILYEDYNLKSDDILKIDIITESKQINLGALDFSSSNTTNNREGLIFDGYHIDSDGYIEFPSIGKIIAKGLSISELKEKIRLDLINNGILTNPIVDIKLLNGHFTILGEVNSPGRYEFLTNNMDILQAIGIAGDLTINAVRTDVKLLRYTDNDKQLITSIDLTNPDFLNNDGFQIFSGDVVIVNPNNRKVKEAGLIEDPARLTSLLSFLISTIILITR